jgi:hypothetical protein
VTTLSLAEPFSGGPEIAELVDCKLVDAELEGFERFLFALLAPLDKHTSTAVAYVCTEERGGPNSCAARSTKRTSTE